MSQFILFKYPMPPFGILTMAMVESFHRHGFLLLDRAITTSEISTLNKRIDQIVRQDTSYSNPTILDADQQNSAETQQKLRESSRKISCFYEKAAFCEETGKPFNSKFRAVGKIGHSLHDLDPIFSHFIRRERFLNMVGQLGMVKPQLVQSMCIFKQPQIGAEIKPHQNSSFVYTEKESTVTFWFALEDATPDNGCLRVAPYGHLEPLRKRYCDVNGNLEMKQLDKTPLPECSTALPVRAGTLILLHGRLPHASDANKSINSRRSVSYHLIDGVNEYASDNWLQRGPDMPLQGFNKPDPKMFPAFA